MKSLVDIRNDKNITQQEMAKSIGVAVSAYCMYERGLRGIPIDKAQKIAEKLDLKINDIFLPTTFTICKSIQGSNKIS